MKKIFQKLLGPLNKLFFPFYKSQDIKNLFEKLEKGERPNKDIAMFVGGCVRNFLDSKKIDDIDIATILSPEDIKKKLQNSEFKVVDTGVEHGSVTVVFNNKSFELTTLRKDIKSFGRHADIKIIDNWKEDSKRRDFTINSIYLNKKGKIFDPQQGVNDLKNKIVKFIGDPQTRIEEDYLRIIRFIRFTIQYNSKVETSTAKAIKLNLNGIKNLSRERILSELFKILKLEKFYDLTKNEELLQVFKLIFPEFENIKRLSQFHLIKNNISNSVLLFLSIMLIDRKKNHEYFCHKYRVSKKINEKLFLLGNKFEDLNDDKEFFKKNLRINLYHIGIENTKILYCLYLLDKKKISKNDIDFLTTIEKTPVPIFPYDGRFLINKGFKEGKKIGKVLKTAEKAWVKNNFTLSMTQLEVIIKDSTYPN